MVERIIWCVSIIVMCLSVINFLFGCFTIYRYFFVEREDYKLFRQGRLYMILGIVIFAGSFLINRFLF